MNKFMKSLMFCLLAIINFVCFVYSQQIIALTAKSTAQPVKSAQSAKSPHPSTKTSKTETLSYVSSASSQSLHLLSYKDFKILSTKTQFAYIKILRTLLISIENEQNKSSAKSNKKTTSFLNLQNQVQSKALLSIASILFEDSNAYAARTNTKPGDLCVHSGFIKKANENGKCLSEICTDDGEDIHSGDDDDGSSEETKQTATISHKKQCNPLLFGSGICVDPDEVVGMKYTATCSNMSIIKYPRSITISDEDKSKWDAFAKDIEGYCKGKRNNSNCNIMWAQLDKILGDKKREEQFGATFNKAVTKNMPYGNKPDSENDKRAVKGNLEDKVKKSCSDIAVDGEPAMISCYECLINLEQAKKGDNPPYKVSKTWLALLYDTSKSCNHESDKLETENNTAKDQIKKAIDDIKAKKQSFPVIFTSTDSIENKKEKENTLFENVRTIKYQIEQMKQLINDNERKIKNFQVINEKANTAYENIETIENYLDSAYTTNRGEITDENLKSVSSSIDAMYKRLDNLSNELNTKEISSKKDIKSNEYNSFEQAIQKFGYCKSSEYQQDDKATMNSLLKEGLGNNLETSAYKRHFHISSHEAKRIFCQAQHSDGLKSLLEQSASPDAHLNKCKDNIMGEQNCKLESHKVSDIESMLSNGKPILAVDDLGNCGFVQKTTEKKTGKTELALIDLKKNGTITYTTQGFTFKTYECGSSKKPSWEKHDQIVSKDPLSLEE